MLHLIWTCAFLIVSSLLNLNAQAAEQEVLVDRVVAIVNGKPILYSEIQEKIHSGFPVGVSFYPATEDSSVFDKALQDAINVKLIEQKAEELEIDVPPEELDKQIQETLKYRNLTEENLRDELAKTGMSYEVYRNGFKQQMLFRKFQGRVIRPLVKITEKDVETFYLKKTGSSAENIRLTLRQLLIAVPSEATEDVIDAKLKLTRMIQQKIQGGMSFAEAVKIYSDDPQAKTTEGLMTDIKLSDLSDEVREPIKALDIGQVSQPVKTSLGFHLFFLESKKFSGSQEFQRKKTDFETELMLIESDVQTKKWLSEMRRKTDIKIVAE